MAAPTETTALARRFRVDIDTGFPGAASWAQLKGVTDWKDAVEPTHQGSGDYDSDWEGMQRTKLKWSAEATFLRKQTLAGDVLDAAAEKIRASIDQFGEAATVHLRYYDRDGGSEAYEVYALATWSRANSGQADLDAVTVKFEDVGQGRTTITNPLA